MVKITNMIATQRKIPALPVEYLDVHFVAATEKAILIAIIPNKIIEED